MGATSRHRRSEPDTLYSALSVAAASKDGAVYRSKDKGKTWQRFDKVQVHGTIMSVALHQTDPKQVYLGARYDGEIFGTQDGGETWQSMNLPHGREGHLFARLRLSQHAEGIGRRNGLKGSASPSQNAVKAARQNRIEPIESAGLDAAHVTPAA